MIKKTCLTGILVICGFSIMLQPKRNNRAKSPRQACVRTHHLGAFGPCAAVLHSFVCFDVIVGLAGEGGGGDINMFCNNRPNFYPSGHL